MKSGGSGKSSAVEPGGEKGCLQSPEAVDLNDVPLVLFECL